MVDLCKKLISSPTWGMPIKATWDECNHLMSTSFIIKNNSVPFGAIEITKKWSFITVKEQRQSINYFREKEEKGRQ